jgi:TnpA family transposase
MTACERTAYPRFKPVITDRDLDDLYTPTEDDRRFLEQATTQEPALRLNVMLLLKCFQALGYFPELDAIPAAIVQHIRLALKIPSEVMPGYTVGRTLYRHHEAIRAHLQVRPFDGEAQRLIEQTVRQAAQTMDDPADLINAGIEVLIQQRYELPAFSQFERLVGHLRAEVNAAIFQKVFSRLTADERATLDQLLVVDPAERQSPLNVLKQEPGSPSISHLRALRDRLAQLQAIIDVQRLLVDVLPTKLVHLGADAKLFDAPKFQELERAKRYTYLLCLLHQTQMRARDDLVEMFLRRIARIHKQGKKALEILRKHQQETSDNLMAIFGQIVQQTAETPDDTQLGHDVRYLLAIRGGLEKLRDAYEAIAAYRGNNYLPLLERFYRPHRSLLFSLVALLAIRSTTQDTGLIDAFNFAYANRTKTREWLPGTLDLSFANQVWQHLIKGGDKEAPLLNRRWLEVCIFSCLASELKSGDVYVPNSQDYADTRERLLPWSVCETLLPAYCERLGFPSTARGFVHDLQVELEKLARDVDRAYPENGQLHLNAKGEFALKRIRGKKLPPGAAELLKAVKRRMPERTIMEVLRNVQHWTEWSRHWGLRSGKEALDDPVMTYILTAFTFGCNLEAAQAARHMRGVVSAKTLSYLNRHHVTASKLEASRRDIVNLYNKFDLPHCWGTGKRVSADGTAIEIVTNNLIAQSHIRYGIYGGVVFHYISDMYIALFSEFITCGVWEGIYFLDLLFKNQSDVQPDIYHADTQGQSTVIFALAYLLGIQLRPRIRNWKDLILFRPHKGATYRHISDLFGDPINWKLIEDHWQDVLQIVLSIQAGKLLPSDLLRRLGHESRRNRLYQAFRELGRVMRTLFLLRYISDPSLRREITETENKVEAYHRFTAWLRFGSHGVITHNAPEEHEKRIKYNDLVASALILQNVVDMSLILHELAAEGYAVNPDTVATLSPFLFQHFKRFGEYYLDWDVPPEALNRESFTVFEVAGTS